MLNNLDLLSVGIAVAGTIILGFVAYFNDKKNLSNKSFFWFSIVTAIWGALNYFSYKISSDYLTLWSLRFVLFFAVWQAFFLFNFFYVFPLRIIKYPFWFNWILRPAVFFVSIFVLSPFVFSGFSRINGNIATPETEAGIILFGVSSVSLVVFGILVFLRKMKHENNSNKNLFQVILFGTVFMFTSIIILNLVLPVGFKNVSFIPLGALFVFPFVLFTSYAILRHKLFNIKVAASALLVFVLSVVTFIEVIFSSDISVLILRISVFVLVLCFGILLIKSVLKEVRQREKIEKQQKELEVINLKLASANDRLKELDKQKTEFVSFASHQLRSPLTAIKGYASLILEGDYGAITDDLKHAAQIIFDSTNTLVTVVADYLNVSSIELGQMKYDMKNIDLKDLVASAVEELKKNAESKQIKLSFNCDKAKFYPVKADKEKLKQVLMNIIDNSIKYTPKGEVRVSLTENNDKVLFSVVDTGIGISKEVIPKLFSKFTRAKNANEANIRGTGLGLFIAKEIITAHHGRIWVESGGEGMGSQFYVELSEASS